jgi:hypothetical protein
VADWTNVGAALGSEEQLKVMGVEAQRMLDTARAGDWAVDEETGSHLRRAIVQMQQRLSAIEVNISRLQRAPKFGNDDYAQLAANHFLNAMDSDDQSLVRVFYALVQNLDSLVQAIDEAVSRYDASDEDATKHLGKFKD